MSEEMLNITIRVYYAVMPVCAVLQTAMLLLIAHEVGRIRRRRSRRRQLREEELENAKLD